MLDTFSNATAANFSNLENDLLESTTNGELKEISKMMDTKSFRFNSVPLSYSGL